MDPESRPVLLCQEHSKVLFRLLSKPARDFCNGFLAAEIISRYYPLYVQMHSFDNSTRYAKKKDNWQQIQLILKKIFQTEDKEENKGLLKELSADNIEDLIQNTSGATIVFMKKLYTRLAQKQLVEMPKMASIKDKTPPQWEGTFVLKDKELVKLAEQEDDFFKTEEAKGEKDSIRRGVHHPIEDKAQPAKEETSPEQMKSIRLPKGPQKPISSEIHNEAIEVSCIALNPA